MRLALEATLTGTGVRSLDLRQSLSRVTTPIMHPVAAGFEELRDNLDLARKVGFSVADADRGGGDDDRELHDDRHEPWHDDESEDQAGAIHGEPLDMGRIPVAFRERLRTASRKVAAANNDLSLVFHDPERRSLVVFGDIGGRALETVVDEASQLPSRSTSV